MSTDALRDLTQNPLVQRLAEAAVEVTDDVGELAGLDDLACIQQGDRIADALHHVHLVRDD